ncbi:MAG: HD domain-containing protein [Acetobacteraceae bacterium]|nr:HD domain-containing protein [Acetobacteraceae bacterium]
MTLHEATAAFAPHEALAAQLLSTLGPAGTDGSHDLSHLLRVWRNAAAIAATESGCDMTLLAAAAILHDCVAVEKDSPLRAQASRLAAARAREIVGALGWPGPRVDGLAHAIEAHSFSAGIAPETLEARILQDADRLDAIGAIGVARCFYVGGRMGSALYDPLDPDATARALDDRRFAFDHFSAKLFRLADGFATRAGQAAATERVATMRSFVAAFRSEVDR